MISPISQIILSEDISWNDIDSAMVSDPDFNTLQGDAFNYQLLTRRISSEFTSPDTALIDSAGSMRWTPTQEEVGEYTMTLKVTDLYGFETIETFPLTVLAVNDAPVLEFSETNDFEVINPSNEEVFAIISLGSKEDTNNAVKAAKNAFSKWKETSKEERISLLEKLLTIYKKRFNEMSEAITLEMGSPIDYSSSTHTVSGQSHLEDFILRLKEFNFEEHFDSKSNNHISYEPIGVCGLIATPAFI